MYIIPSHTSYVCLPSLTYEVGLTSHNGRTSNCRKERIATGDENGHHARVCYKIIHLKAAGSINKLNWHCRIMPEHLLLKTNFNLFWYKWKIVFGTAWEMKHTAFICTLAACLRAAQFRRKKYLVRR